MAISLPPPPPPSSLDVSATAPLTPPKSSLPFFLTLSLLSILYFLLSLHLGLDYRNFFLSLHLRLSNLPPPFPSLLPVLSSFIILHFSLPYIVILYAPSTPKGLYGAQWTASNLNVAASSILNLLVIVNEPASGPPAVGFSITGALCLFTAVNIRESLSRSLLVWKTRERRGEEEKERRES